MASDEKPLEPPLRADEKARAKFLEDTAELMRSSVFRRWVWHLIDFRLWCASFMCRNEPEEPFTGGKRWIGLSLQALLMGVATEGYKQMLLEAMNLKLQRELKDPE